MALRFVGLSLLAITLGLCLKLGLLGWQQGTANVRRPIPPGKAIPPAHESASGNAVQVQDVGSIVLAALSFHVAAVKHAIGDDFIGDDATRGQGFPELLSGVHHFTPLVHLRLGWRLREGLAR
jgi:hypothetical protein